jgi:ABC-type phosphate transport system permease subunit
MGQGLEWEQSGPNSISFFFAVYWRYRNEESNFPSGINLHMTELSKLPSILCKLHVHLNLCHYFSWGGMS